jgi:hypothetical protein
MIIVRLQGGMGNQMFQYAAARALSLRKNTSVGIDVSYVHNRIPRSGFTFREYDLDVFALTAPIVTAPALPLRYKLHTLGKLGLYLDAIRRKFFKGLGTERTNTYSDRFWGLPANTYLEGYWQSDKYFQPYEDAIRKDFSLKEPLPSNILQLQKEIQDCESVCIHVRRGDYVAHSFHDVGITQSYYDQGFEYISQKANINCIYVFSDDIQWCRENLSFAHNTVFVGDEYAGKKASGHMMLMSSCKHFIIANSSFSWWAAWLGEYNQKIVIAPKQWFVDTSIDTTDLIPEDWVRI